MRKIWVTVLALAVLGVLAFRVWTAFSHGSRVARADAHLIAAQRAAAGSHWDRAADELRAMLKLEPDSDGAWLMLADVQFRQGQMDQALRSVARVSSRSANGAAARLLEGTLLLQSGQATRAESVLKECLALAPDSVEARRRLVFLYAIELRRDELRQVLWEMHDLNAAETLDIVLLSGSTFIVWNAAELMKLIDSFVSSSPQDVAARVAAGRYRLRQAEFHAARRVLGEACRLAPDDPEPHAALAECLIDTGEFAEAGRLIETLPAHCRRRAAFAYCVARIAEEDDRTEAALAAYADAIESDADHREAHYRLGQLLMQAGRADEAKPHLERAAKLTERETLLSTLVTSGDSRRYAPLIARLESELGHDRLAGVWSAEAARLGLKQAKP